MSRIYEALRRSRGDLSDVARRALPDEQVEAAELPPGTEAADGLSIEAFDRASPTPARFEGPISGFELPALDSLRAVRVRLRAGMPLLPFGGEDRVAAEQYRIIRTKLIQHPKRPRTVAISSAEAGDGKSVSAVNLAGALALNPEFSVLLIDGDLHRTSLASYFNLPARPGLSEVLDGQAALHETIVRIEPYPNLYFSPGGHSPRGPADLLNSQRWPQLLEALRRQFTYVIIDTPPAGALADFDLIEAQCEGVILVVRQDHTKRALWRKALSAVPQQKLIGVVVNCVKPWFLGRLFGYYNNYEYSKYYRSE